MKKFMISMLACLTIISTPTMALDKEIKLHVPFNPSGGGFRLADALVKGLTERGWTIDFKATGNCAIIKSQLESEKIPFVTIFENIYSANTNDKCYIPVPSVKELVNIPAFSPYYLCVAKDSAITDLDILSGKDNYTFSVFNFFSEQIVSELKTKINQNYKAVTYSSPRTALASGEVDVYIGTQGPAMMKDNQAKCYFNSGTTKTNGSIPLNEAKSNLNVNKQSVYFTVAKNLSDEQMTALRTDLKDVMRTYKPWLDLAKLYETKDFKTIEEMKEFIESTLK